jgi:hypothetical protein
MRSHHCPAVLFGIFSDPQTTNARREQLWTLRRGSDGVPKQLPASRVGVETNIYSTTDPQRAEDHFQEYEKDLKKCVQAGLRLSPRPKSGQRDLAGSLLLSHALVLYARNAVHTVESNQDRFDAYQQAAGELHRQVLRGWNAADETEDQFLARETGQTVKTLQALPRDSTDRLRLVADVLARRWEWAILSSPRSEPLVVSDTPARPFSLGGDSVVWLWPLSPTSLFVAVTRERWTIARRRLNEDELARVNSLIVARAWRWALSRDPFSSDDAEAIMKLWQKHEPLDSVFTATEWRNPLRKLPKPSSNLGILQPRLSTTR